MGNTIIMSFQTGCNNTGVLNRKLLDLEVQHKTLLAKYNKLSKTLKQQQSNATLINDKDTIIGSYLSKCDRVPQVLHAFLLDTYDNLRTDSTGKRYKNSHNFFALLSMYGEHVCTVLERALLMPSYRTTLTYRNNFLHTNGYSETIFDGCIGNIQKLIQLNKCPPDTKAILMIDAVYVDPYVSVDENGTISGLINNEYAPVEDPKSLYKDPTLFEKFLKTNSGNIIEAVFVFRLSPINYTHKGFPIYCMPSNTGSAQKEIHPIILEFFRTLQNMDITLIGIGTDGDPQYIKYSRTLVEWIVNNLYYFCSRNFGDIIQNFESPLHFSDPFHLAKRDRYKKIHNRLFCASPIPNEYTIPIETLLKVGIPQYVLADERARKMEDDLPLKMFSSETIHKIVQANNIQLLTAMLPTALLLDTIHTENLTRITRIEQLLFGAAIVLNYYVIQNEYINNPKKLKRTERKQYKLYNCFSQQWCIEYISLTVCMASFIQTEKQIDLGAFGSHPLEHLFGNVRRVCRGEDTYQNFLASLISFQAESELASICGIELPQTSGKSDSGEKLNDDPIQLDIHFTQFLQQARRLMQNFHNIPNIPILDEICTDKSKMSLDECMILIPHFFEKNRKFISTKSQGITSTGGLTNLRRWTEKEQIKNL